jgi:hypothetical protein
MNDLRRELAEKPPLSGSYTPKKGKYKKTLKLNKI